MIPEEKPVWGTEITREMVDPGYGNMWSVGLKHYKCKEDSSDRYIINDGRLHAGHARVATRQGVEWRKTTKNTLQYFEDEADYRLYVGINAGIVYNSDPTSRISNFVKVQIKGPPSLAIDWFCNYVPMNPFYVSPPCSAWACFTFLFFER